MGSWIGGDCAATIGPRRTSGEHRVAGPLSPAQLDLLAKLCADDQASRPVFASISFEVRTAPSASVAARRATWAMLLLGVPWLRRRARVLALALLMALWGLILPARGWRELVMAVADKDDGDDLGAAPAHSDAALVEGH